MEISTYLDAIVSIRDKITNTCITWKALDIQLIAAKYSNTKQPIYKLVIDNTPISRNNTLLVKYKCTNCKLHQEITLNLFVRKINKKGKYCISCVNDLDEKKTAHSDFMKENARSIIAGDYKKPDIIGEKSISLADHIAKSILQWEDEDDDFKFTYNMKHLIYDEFERIRHMIKSVNHRKLTNINDWEYMPYYKIFNQSKYTPMLINKSLNQIEKPQYVAFDCENCGEEFCHRDLEIVKNKLKIYCKECSFTNKTFKLRTMKLKNGNTIKWQSTQEKRFIEWCDMNEIAIKNGPRLEYMFGEKTHKYHVDFELPDLKYLIEIKDNHCWFKQQVKSGKQHEKDTAANNWCKTNEYTYSIVFPHNLSEIKNLLLRKSCKI